MTEQLPRTLKIILGTLFVVLFLTLTFAFLAQRKSKGTTTPTIIPSVSLDANQIPPAEIPKPNQKRVETTPPTNLLTPAPSVSATELEKQLLLLDEQVKAGTITPEEARKQINDFNTKNQPVTAPVPTIKK